MLRFGILMRTPQAARDARSAVNLASFVLLLTTRLDTLWIILGAALVSLSASSLGLIQQL
jgi:hypothetical protein